MSFKFLSLSLIWLLTVQSNCSKKNGGDEPNPPITPPVVIKNEVDFWLTKADQSILLKKQTDILAFGTPVNVYPTITVDPDQKFQTIDGFGYTLTSGSAQLINAMSASAKSALLQELFGKNENSIGISYLRVAIGASDLSANVYSYNDMPEGQTDPALTNFSLEPDMATGTGVIPLLKEILAINPNIKIMGSPWSPPVWMKDNGSSIGGSLKPEYHDAYAQYFVKYIQQMKAHGITIDAITPQNEPLHPGNNPSLLMLPEQQSNFIKNSLGPALQAAGITTRIIIYDHNLDRTDYPISILNDPEAKKYIDGSAFHLYAGDVSGMTTVHNAHPDKHVYFTEQWTGSKGTFDGDLQWHLKNVIIGTMRNWSRVALEWNLANDPNFGPHTPGGCTECKGALTISGSSVTRNVSYYIVAHAAKFVPAGSVRVASNNAGSLHSVAFVTPAGKNVLIVLNDANTAASFNIQYKGKKVATHLPVGGVGSYTW